MDDNTLIKRILDGDQEAFADLVRQHERQVYNLCLRMCTNPEDAKDLTQEAFIKAWRGLRFYKFESAFSTWLYRLTANVCIDFLRQQKRKATLSLVVQDDEQKDTELDTVDPEPLPEEQLLQQEANESIAAAMNLLEEDFRMILTLRVVEDLSYEQIAEIMDLKIGTVKSRLARARNKLKNILERSGNFFDVGSSETKEGRRRNDM